MTGAYPEPESVMQKGRICITLCCSLNSEECPTDGHLCTCLSVWRPLSAEQLHVSHLTDCCSYTRLVRTGASPSSSHHPSEHTSHCTARQRGAERTWAAVLRFCTEYGKQCRFPGAHKVSACLPLRSVPGSMPCSFLGAAQAAPWVASGSYPAGGTEVLPSWRWLRRGVLNVTSTVGKAAFCSLISFCSSI